MSKRKQQSSLSEFGTRKLENEETVFEHNAWDQVDMDQEMKREAEEKIKAQRVSKVSDHACQEFDTLPARFWDKFYSNNNNKFFKDRRWLSLEFPELFESKDNPKLTICEVGCGAGNTIFPILNHSSNPNLFVYGFDYSSEAISIVQASELYDTKRCKALVFDITNPNLPLDIPLGQIDICICIFVLSAINPRDWPTAVDNIYKMLKPGGLLLFRDYGRYDLAQVRFKANRLLDDNFYCRGDGTRVYFFTNEELQSMFSRFEVLQNEADKRLLVNRQKKLKMYRCWLQGKFKKPIEQDGN
jgi:tRNAThr (cytosine32-N3)-methyltransferase